MGHSEMETFPSLEAIKPQKMINRFNLEMVPALRLAKIDVSSSVIRGEPAWLNCSYTLEGDELYSVKWYKNNVEFYRFLPTDRPPGQKYDLQGVYVDLDQSFEGYVYLKRTDLNTEGVYRCEVSAEAPSFQTVREEKEVRVYETMAGRRVVLRFAEIVFPTRETSSAEDRVGGKDETFMSKKKRLPSVNIGECSFFLCAP
ncbi:ig-like domain-containing protein [Caerostris extrusa]|uniref:Ig-like domain-containing protein n=1 Tax=Caerostris extrusa TaxID=172846 RepID=A0AAV4XEV2_CAEEX|nr:ig-like domain-containing protein [Caerostris extrusa]